MRLANQTDITGGCCDSVCVCVCVCERERELGNWPIYRHRLCFLLGSIIAWFSALNACQLQKERERHFENVSVHACIDSIFMSVYN